MTMLVEGGPARPRSDILLQKADSLLMLECSGKLKGFLQDDIFEIRFLHVFRFYR